MKKKLVVLYIFCSLIKISLPANILVFTPVAMHSHQVYFQPIWKEMSLRGHKVTVYTPQPLNDPNLTNLTEISISELNQFTKNGQIKDAMYESNSPYSGFHSMFEKVFMPSIEPAFELPAIQKLLRDNSSKYDVVIVEPLPAIYLALGQKFNCPVILIFSLNPYSAIHESFGNPVHPVMYPDIPLSDIEGLNFFQRLYNTFQNAKISIYHDYSVIPRTDIYVKKYFGPKTPYLRNIIRNASLMFIGHTSGFSLERPKSPATIPLSFLHIRPKRKLPNDVQKVLDESKQGVIYVSLGSSIKSAYLTNNLMGIFKKTFQDIPYRVLWKFENDTLSGISKNVYWKKWFPQQDVLGHPNVKLYVMQGGYQSTEEAIYNKIPLIVLPFITDQRHNGKLVVKAGVGQLLNPFTLTSEEFKKTILEVIQNDKYKNNMVELSSVSRDQVMTGVDRAIWWTEYVIRHKGAHHLKNFNLNSPKYQYYMLDIILFVIFTLYLIFFIVRRLGMVRKLAFTSFIFIVIAYVVIE